MIIARISLALILACAAQAQSTKTAKIEEIFRLTNVDAMLKQMVNQITSSLPAQMGQIAGNGADQAQASQFAKEMMQMVADRMSWDKMKPLYLRMYDETFTEDEISGLLLFYESAAGKALISKTPALMTKSIALAQEQMKTIGPEIQQKAREMAESHKNDKP